MGQDGPSSVAPELTALLGGSGHTALAARLGDGPELGEADVVEIAALVAALPTAAIEEHPRALLELARAAEVTVHTELRSSLLERTARLADGDSALALEVEAEVVRDLARDGDADEAERRGAAVLAAAGAGDPAARARALEGLGRTAAWRGTPADLARAEGLLAEAAGLAGAIGRADWRSTALLCLGYRVHFDRGEFARAEVRVREAVELCPAQDRQRGVMLTFFAEVLVAAGHTDEVDEVLAEASRIGRRLGDQRLLAYAAWAHAKESAAKVDEPGTLAWLEEAERHPGDWFDHPTGAEFLADAAVLADRVGATSAARRYLDRASDRAQAVGLDEITMFASGALAARSGNPAAAEVPLVAALDSLEVPPREVWRIHLLRALARMRSGDRAGAQRLVEMSLAAAAAIGAPELPARQEPAAMRVLRPVLPKSARAKERRVEVKVLGGFSVVVDGEPVHVPDGRPAQLAKAIAVSARAPAIDEMIEVLWPDSDADTGRRRLRNVLARLNAPAGELVVRHGEQLAFVDGVAIDAAAFVESAESALAAPVDERAPLARVALAHFTGDLLPGDLYEDWASAPRERLRGLAVAMLTAVLDEAERSGDLAEAIDVLERISQLDPLDERHPVRAVRLLTIAGQPREAAGWARRARQLCTDLRIPEPADVTAALI